MTEFSDWMEAMGFNKKQMAQAGKLLGHSSPTTSQLSYHGERELSDAERLAMSALLAGLKPWPQQSMKELQLVKAVMGVLRDPVPGAEDSISDRQPPPSSS